MLHRTKKKILIISAILGLLLVLGIIFVLSRNNGKKVYETITVERGDLRQEVDVTGTVSAVASADLAFETSGKVTGVSVKIGDAVSAGATLVTLDQSALTAKMLEAQAQADGRAAQVREAQASLMSGRASIKQYQAAMEQAQAKLAELKQGATAEQIALAQTKVSNAKKSLIDTETSLQNVTTKATSDLVNLYDDTLELVTDNFTKADDAVNKQISDLFTKTGANYELSFSTTDSQARNDIERQRPQLNLELVNWQSELNQLQTNTSQAGWDQALEHATNHLTYVRDFLVRMMDALNGGIETTGVNSTTLNTYRTSVITSRNNLNSELGEIKTLQQAIVAQKVTNSNNTATAQSTVNTAKNTLAVAESELQVTTSPATSQALATQEAAIRQAAANLEAQKAQLDQAQATYESRQASTREAAAQMADIKVQLSKTILTAPFSGQVTAVKPKIGELVSAQTVAVSIINPDVYKIETYIPEADIAKIKVGNQATVTFDAYSDDEQFTANVTFIDPAETMVEGVATYKTTLELAADPRVRSGLTANLSILAAKRDQVLAVPQRAVKEINSHKYVTVLEPGTPGHQTTTDIVVETGLRGSDGRVEIISGLIGGEQVVIYTENK